MSSLTGLPPHGWKTTPQAEAAEELAKASNPEEKAPEQSEPSADNQVVGHTPTGRVGLN